MLSLNNQRVCLTALTLARLLVIACCLLADSDHESKTDSSRFKPIGLFDYESYKNTYNKHYRTSLEDSTRRCYLYARAMAVFVSGVNYKYRVRDHYNALNEMSDWSPEERDRIKNKRIHPMITRSMTRESKKSLAFLPAEGERPEETLLNFLESKKASNPRYRDLLNELNQSQSEVASSRRSKRSSDSVRPPRNFSFKKLINYDPSPEPVARQVRVESNNPNYEFIETMSRGLRDQIEEVELITTETREVNEQELGSLESQLESELGSLKIKDSISDAISHENLEDAIFFDHRESPCMNKVRSQGKCGSCYAFATITILEWIYCTKKGLLVDFSEQYMIDCGLSYIDGIYGCEGGTIEAVYDFVHNFGVELRSKYPYVYNNGTCPYDEATNLKTTGYIRMELDGFMNVPLDDWPEALEREPLYILIQLVEDFYEYAGGVYDGAQCLSNSEATEDLHSMVLVGHGREDGQEFWLIRNSHGKNWGEHGYYKLAKSASNCIYTESAYALTWTAANGKEVVVRPYRNRHHNEAILSGKVSRKKKTKRGNVH